MNNEAKRDLVDARFLPFPEYPNIVGLFETIAEGPTGKDQHSHTCAEINIMLDGHGVWCTGDAEYQVKPGDALLFMPGTPHYTKWPPGARYRSGSVDFHLDLFGQSVASAEEPPGYPATPLETSSGWLFKALSHASHHRLTWEQLPEWWQHLCEEEQAVPGPYRALRVESALHEVLARFADPAFRQPDWQHAERRGIERALRHISRKINEGPVTVTELARVAGMSRSKFAEVFRDMVGSPPHTYTTGLRMYMAQSALAGSRATAASIANSLGFSSPQHFSRAFKAATGLTPNEYRKRWGAPWLKEG
jgi:AraC-like DNA-binding protein